MGNVSQIGGDKWRDLMRAFVSEFKRQPTAGERKTLARMAGFNTPAKKTKGRATDYQRHGATPWQVRRSESVNGGIAADNDKGLVAMRDKAPRLNKPITAKQ